ncbi:MAG: PTS sugar transporter subunit IIC [Lachnospiraceae bacterium]|jgi:PTS system cellobiose-specific IIC component|nr:PTS sugar transporter subunit IIC [Lachnospiraceae bacterium]
MDGLLNNPVMLKLQEFGQKLGTNKFLSSLQAAMMSLMGIIMVGAISQIICAVGSETMLGLFTTGDAVYNALYMPYQFTMNCLSLWVVVLMAFNYARTLKMKSPVMNAVDALVCFLIVAGTLRTTESGTAIDMAYLGSTGMFIGFLVVFVSVQIEKFCADKNIRIKMPDVVPQFLQDGFSSILPLLFSVIVFQVASTLVSVATGGVYTICSGFLALLAAPLGALTSVPGTFILCIFAALLWCFGIHGTMVIFSVLMPMMIDAAVTNGAAHAAGQPLTFFPIALFSGMACCGGSGNTLMLALFSTRSKSKQLSAVGKISAVPGWFGINEPMTFGMPIMYNPILCIPYILNIPVVMLITLLAYKVGFLTPGWISITALLPMGFGGYLSTLRWQHFVWDYLMLIPTGLVWYPFFKIYEKQLIEKEKAAEAAEG